MPLFKRKNGFTLVELIAIILILSIILTVSFTSLSKTIENSNNQEYQTLINNIEMATENYVNLPGIYREVDEKLKNGGSYEVNITDLISAGIIDEMPINPKSKKRMENGKIIVSKNSNNELMYKVEIEWKK